LSAIINGKGLQWNAEYGPYGEGQNTIEFRNWMREQAQELKNRASEIKAAVAQTN
jgi:hypothetical protein